MSVFSLRKRYRLAFHELYQFSLGVAFPRGSCCQHFVRHDPNRENIRFVGVDVFDQALQRHVEGSSYIKVTLVELVLGMAAKPEINNFPQVIFADDVLGLEVAMQDFQANQV